jgi:hypothetical protein
MMPEINMDALRRVYEGLRDLKDRWAPDDDRSVDDAEDMWVEVPEFLRWAVPEMGIALGLLEPPKFHLKSAVYGGMNRTIDVTETVRSKTINGKIEIQVLNTVFGCDPDINQKKVLKVEYLTNSKLKQVIVEEGEWFRVDVE